ncbi:MAG: outer membrane protein assembly factor BamD [Dermatophilaceae bacterium]|jgi:tetratricopeptide (TPR) repeat protein
MATFVTAMLEGREPYDIYRWAQQLFADRDHLAAIEALEHLLDRAPDSELGAARELLTRAYYHSAQLDKAAASARELLAKDPDHGYAALLLYRSLVRGGRRDEAERARLWALALGMDVSGRDDRDEADSRAE